MNASENTACAFSGNSVSWSQLNWEYAHRAVRKLQARIVKGTMDNTVVAGPRNGL